MKTINIRTMTPEDLALGLRLSRQARWNQTEADWLRLVSFEPWGCFVAELDGRPVGTTTTCILGTVAWIAMVVVDKNARGRGVGTRLLTHAIEFLESRKVRTIRLDATPAGRIVYEKLGFVAEYELARYEGIASCQAGSANVTESAPEVYAYVMEFDKKKTGTDRTKMLVGLFDEFPESLRIVRRGETIEGYCTSRPGANAIHVGPCVATPDTGQALLSDALDRCRDSKVFVDVPRDNIQAVSLVESAGLKIQRCFTRMYRGKKVDDDVAALWAGSGPEKG